MSQWRVIDVQDDGTVVDEPLRGDVTRQAALARAGVLKTARGAAVGRTSIHRCPHSAGEPSGEWYDCRRDPRAGYTEV